MIDLNMDFKDYYKSLNIGIGATDEAIKKAYKQLAKKYHPDSDGGSEEKFKEIQEAYEVLKDKDRRAKYDTLYKSHKNSGQSSFNSAGFGSGAYSYQSSSQQNNSQANKKSQESKQNSSAYDYYKQESQRAREKQENTGSQQRTYQQKQYSSAKKTTGNNQNQTKQSDSKSTKDNNFSDFFNMFFGGETKNTNKSSRGDDYELAIELDLEDAYHGCTRKLEISSTGQGLRRLEVMIPAGVRDGNKIKIAGEGKVGRNGGENGDLYLKIRIKEHPMFRLEDDDVHSTLALEPYEAILGTEKEVVTLGSKVEIVIPPQTQNGKILRLRNRGLPNPKAKTQGDHYVHTEIKIKDHYSFEELQHYKAIKRVNEM